jgi:hypothetical protein
VRLRARAFWLPKAGNPIEDWEDACAYSEARSLLSLSDGASSSFRAHEWASTLVTDFLASPPTAPNLPALEVWVAERAARFETLPLPNGDAWYVDEAAGRGAFATFLGFAMDADGGTDETDWTAIAVGDSCLFHVRSGRCVHAFPVSAPDAFTTTPALLSSKELDRSYGARDAVIAQGRCAPGDVFLLATDALAQWALQAALEDDGVWSMLAGLRHETFLALLATLRGADAIQNDDVTLVRALVEPGGWSR